MNYNEYVETLQPRAGFKEDTVQKIKCEITRRNTAVRRRRVCTLSAAACLVLLAAVFAVYKYSSAQNYIPLSPETPSSNEADSQTANEADTQMEKEANTEIAEETGEADEKNSIVINTAADDVKWGEMYIVIDDRVYQHYVDSRDAVVISAADIGEELCLLDENNMVLAVDQDGFSRISELYDVDDVKISKFYGAVVYQYEKCKNDTVLLVQTGDDFCMFTLCAMSLTEPAASFSAADILDFYAASGENAVVSIDVQKAGYGKFDEEVVEYSKTIADEALIQSAQSIIKSAEASQTGCIEVPDGAEECTYYLTVNYADGTSLTAEFYYPAGVLTLMPDYMGKNCWYELNYGDIDKLKSLFSE